MASTSPGGRGLSFSIGGLSPSGGLPRAGQGQRSGSPSEEQLRVLVVADCSGRRARGLREPLAGRPTQRVDVERLDAVMVGWRARVSSDLVDGSGEPLWLEPRSLEDLHPDRLLDTVPALSELASLLGRAAADPTARARLTERLGIDERRGAPPAAHARGAAALSAESSVDTLERLLGGVPMAREPKAPEARALAPRAPGQPDISHWIRAIVGQSLPEVRETPPSHAGLVAAAEAELGHRLRSVLHAPALRKLEATWRGIDGLCRTCPDEERVHCFVLDASFDELAADASALGAVLDSCTPSVLLVDELLLDQLEPLLALCRLLEVCQEREVLLLIGAHPHLAGCAHFEELTQPDENEHPLSADVRAALQQLLGQRERGARLALALPRFLLRQPYGADGDPIERFPFEEVLAPYDHEAFPWGNGAYLVARAVAQRYVSSERGAFADGSIDVRELPVVYLESASEGRIKPCAEAWLSERALGRLRAAGFAVLQGLRDTDRIRVHL